MNKHHTTQNHGEKDPNDHHTSTKLDNVSEEECVLVNKKLKRGKPQPQIMCPTVRQITMQQQQDIKISNPETDNNIIVKQHLTDKNQPREEHNQYFRQPLQVPIASISLVENVSVLYSCILRINKIKLRNRCCSNKMHKIWIFSILSTLKHKSSTCIISQSLPFSQRMRIIYSRCTQIRQTS